ncbi:hypothetical protein MHYP_G00025460 [Metynnis hypsauchen]
MGASEPVPVAVSPVCESDPVPMAATPRSKPVFVPGIMDTSQVPDPIAAPRGMPAPLDLPAVTVPPDPPPGHREPQTPVHQEEDFLYSVHGQKGQEVDPIPAA